MQRRRAEEKEKQEKIRLGLIPPPPPKGTLYFPRFFQTVLQNRCIFPFDFSGIRRGIPQH